jgi:diaminopimelate decarboxylase
MITCDSLVYQPFRPAGGELACDGVSIQSIVERAGTPTYIYSARAIREAYRDIDDAFASYPHAIHYALKANSTLAIARLLQSLGSRADANSGGEIAVAERAGFAPRDIVFTGVGKTREELEYADHARLGTINAESAGRLDRIAAIAQAHGRVARVAVRVNPDIDARSHPNISTGLKTNKFGVPLQDARPSTGAARRRGAAVRRCPHPHRLADYDRGSPETCRGVTRVTRPAAPDEGFALEHVDLGGGLASRTKGVQSSSRRITPVRSSPNCGVWPAGGARARRAVVGRAGALIGRIVDTKCFPDGRKFAVLDAGMTELMRPALYGSFHRIEPVVPRTGGDTAWDVVGPICESSDVFGPRSCAAATSGRRSRGHSRHGRVSVSAMSSNYNRHLLPAEVLVDDGKWSVIRRRQTLDDVLALES